MRTPVEALKEIRDRISYFCSRTDGKYDPPWAQEVIGIIDDVLIMPYRRCKRFSAPFYVEVGTSIVAIRCASNHDVVWRADHSVHGKATIDWAESVCTRMNQEANKHGCGNVAKLREALEHCRNCAQMIPQFVQGSRPERSSLDAAARYANAIVGEVKAALSVPPRACDIMSEADLSKVVTSGIVASIEPRPELNTVGAKTLIEIAVASAIKCAYDTQLVSTKEGVAK